MKQTHFAISVPEPCQEGWDQMTPCEKGRFCGSCQKTVIDFTGYTDAELASFFFRNKNEPVCGHFYAHQIENKIFSYTAPVKRPYRTLAMAASVAALTVLSFTVDAQDVRGAGKQTNAPLIHVTQYKPDTLQKKQDRPILTAEDIERARANYRNGAGMMVPTQAGVPRTDKEQTPVARKLKRIVPDRNPERVVPDSTAPEKPLLQVPSTQTYTGEEWDRRQRTNQNLGAQ